MAWPLHLLRSWSLRQTRGGSVYAELYARVEELAEPRDIWDQMMVADVVNHFWEQQRYRRSTGAIINSARCLALRKKFCRRSASIGATPPRSRIFTSAWSGTKETREYSIPILRSSGNTR